MPFIMSPYDIRLVTLVGIAIDLSEELALTQGLSAGEHLANALYKANKNIHERGEEKYMNRLATDYPILKEVIS